MDLVEKLLFCDRACVGVGLHLRAYNRRSCEEDDRHEYPENRCAVRDSPLHDDLLLSYGLYETLPENPC